MTGKCEFTDEKNGITGWYEIGANLPTKQTPKDYVYGQILKNGEVVGECRGFYTGHLDFNGERYFDLRDNADYHAEEIGPDRTISGKPGSFQRRLQSDCTQRTDVIALLNSDVEQAQVNKNDMEML